LGELRDAVDLCTTWCGQRRTHRPPGAGPPSLAADRRRHEASHAP